MSRTAETVRRPLSLVLRYEAQIEVVCTQSSQNYLRPVSQVIRCFGFQTVCEMLSAWRNLWKRKQEVTADWLVGFRIGFLLLGQLMRIIVRNVAALCFSYVLFKMITYILILYLLITVIQLLNSENNTTGWILKWIMYIWKLFDLLQMLLMLYGQSLKGISDMVIIINK